MVGTQNTYYEFRVFVKKYYSRNISQQKILPITIHVKHFPHPGPVARKAKCY